MAQLLQQIEWSDPILPPVSDPAWEAEVKRRAGRVFNIDLRVSPNPWVREMCVSMVSYRPVAMPQRLFNIGSLVTAQENACRYCYGANRALMRVLGYSESFINQIEREASIAELDDKEREFIRFCRRLARSRPRPMKADRDALVGMGFAPLAVGEMAMQIAMSCFYNRIGVLTACPPEVAFENMAGGLVGRLTAPLMRLMMSMKKPAQPATLDEATLARGPFGPIVATLAGLPGAANFRAALDNAFASTALPATTKALMFAVVARTLGCASSEAEARKLLAGEGLGDSEVDAALSTLRSPRLSANEAGLLSWVRDTVYYQTASIQKGTHELVGKIGNEAALEAIGISALANATVRLGMLLE